MTRFLREIVEAGKSPVQQMIDAWILENLGCFQSDLVTAKEISQSLRSYSFIAPEWDHIDMRACTPNKVTTILKSMNNTIPFYCRDSNRKVTIWCVRDHLKYQHKSPGEILDDHQATIERIRKTTKLKAI